MLIENLADVNAADSRGFSSLHWAVYDPMQKSEEIVKILIENGANINKKTNSGDTPRDLAEQKGNSVTNQFTKIIQIIEIILCFLICRSSEHDCDSRFGAWEKECDCGCDTQATIILISKNLV